MTKQDLLQIKKLLEDNNENLATKKELVNMKQEILDKMAMEFITRDEKNESEHAEIIKFIQEQTDIILKSNDLVAKVVSHEIRINVLEARVKV